MGEVTRILITGASGFVGGAVVRAARAQGIDVIAQYRSLPHANWESDAGIEPLRLDLSDPGAQNSLKEQLPGVDAVIHAAAHMGDDPKAHETLSVGGTKTLLDAMQGEQARLVLVSSIAVYDTMALKPGDLLDEASPLETTETARDPYTKAKLAQEALVRDARQSAWLIRPGAVWGSGRTWHALLGFWASKIFVQIGGDDGELPVVHVDHLAELLIKAARTVPPGIVAVNALDDDRPSRARFVSAHRKWAGWPRLVLPISFAVWLKLIRLLKPVASRLPGLFREPIARARLMPLSYSNEKGRSILAGPSQADFETLLAQSLEDRP